MTDKINILTLHVQINNNVEGFEGRTGHARLRRAGLYLYNQQKRGIFPHDSYTLSGSGEHFPFS
jgi:hypothetical protein